MGSSTLAVLKLRQDFLSSSGGRAPHSLLKIIMKMALFAAVLFLVYVMSGLTEASGGGSADAKGPQVTHEVTFEVAIGGKNPIPGMTTTRSSSACLASPCPRLPKTSGPWPRARRDSATRDPSSTGSSTASCCREETSPGATAPAASPSTETSLQMRTSS